jgi:3-isopropylmalate/(R)-2-methylmalate dehydratase small subunit
VISRITHVSGPALVMRGNDIDTDRIMPARFLKAITFDGIETHLFEDDRREAAGRGAVHPFEDVARRDARILVVNANFGCGSSREHAPQALLRRGLRAVVGASFAEIFLGNSVAIGLPCVTASHEHMAEIMALADASPDAELSLDLERERVTIGARVFPVSLPATAKHAFVTGEWDGTSLLLERYEDVQRVGNALPYTHWQDASAT